MQEDTIIANLKNCKTLKEFLIYIRDTEDLNLICDNGWSWIEYKGREIPNTSKERFTSQDEINVLLDLAGL